MEAWKAREGAASARRVELTKDALQELLGGEREDLPRVGVCLSGGGWRAMTSGCALFDALSVPVDAKESHDGKNTVKLLDCVSHAFGLSGGSWLLFTTLCGGKFNPFHFGFEAGDTGALAQRGGKNPWFYGKQNSFDPAVHKYDGLARMVAKGTIDTACHRGSLRRKLGFVTATTNTDSTIAAALASKRLGESLVDRWSNFIANDLLCWMDDASTDDSSMFDEVGFELLDASDAVLSESAKSAKQLAAERLAKQWETDNAARSRQVELSTLGEHIVNGDLPFFVCSAIANRQGQALSSTEIDPATGQPYKSTKPGVYKSSKRAYDWVEFTPFFSRSPTTGTYIEDVKGMSVMFSHGLGSRVPLRVHHLMGICGSAFACDMACALPAGVSRRVELPHSAIIGRGTSDVFGPAHSGGESSIGTLRDAGIDFNVPLPPMLTEAGREFDLLIVHDAGGGSVGPYELQRAVELGYVELVEGTVLTKPFNAHQRVKVFRGKGGFPTIVYFLGLTQRGTHQVIQGASHLHRDVDGLRSAVERFLKPVLLQELRNVQRFKQVSRLNPVGASVGDKLAAAADFFAQAPDGSDDADVPATIEPDEEAADVATASDRMGEILGSLPQATQQIIFNAAARGVASDPFTAMLEVESVLMQAVEDQSAVPGLLAVLEGCARRNSIFKHPLEGSIRDTFLQLGALTSEGEHVTVSRAFTEFWTATSLIQFAIEQNDRCSVPFWNRRSGNQVEAPSSLPLSTDSRAVVLAAQGCTALGVSGALASKLAPFFREEAVVLVELTNTPKGCDTSTIAPGSAGSQRVERALMNMLAVEAVVGRATPDALLATVNANITYAASRCKVTNKHWIERITDNFKVALATVSVVMGIMDVLAAVLAESPKLFADNNDYAKRLCGVAPDSPNPPMMTQFLFTHIGASASFGDACRLSLIPLMRELVHERQHLDRSEDTMIAIEHGNEACVTLIIEHASTPEFRKWIAKECVRRKYYWDAVTPYVDSMDIDANNAEASVSFAEKCKRLTKIGEGGPPQVGAIRERVAALQQKSAERASRVAASDRVAAARVQVSAAAHGAQQKASATVASVAGSAKKLFGAFGKKK